MFSRLSECSFERGGVDLLRYGRISIAFAVLSAATCMFAQPQPARADEGYLCGPDHVVYVASADLELKKKTDPCIAGYYGLTIEEPIVVTVADEKKPAKPVAADVAPRAPVASVRAVAGQLKLLPRDEPTARVAPRLEQQAFLEPPRSSKGTDYRNVRVINASAADATWYRHTK